MGTFEKQKQRTHREGQRIASVSANVLNVVRAYDCFHENGTTYTVMEYIDGGTLSDIVDKNGPFGWPQAYERLKPVMEALEKMHVEHRIYHLDISPDNIMFRRRANGSYGEPVLVDFGASVEAEPSGETKSMSSMVVKNGFAPPEQYIIGYSEMTKDANGTALMDEYAMCATLYFAITGETPVASITRLGGEDNLKPLSDFDRNIPDYIENAIAKGMSIQAQDRYTSMKALIRALENPPEHNPPEHTDTPEPPWRKIVAIAAVGAILAVVVGVILVINRTQGDRAQTIALNAEGQFTWTKSSGVEAGALVGKAGEQEIRYELRDSEVVTLNGAMIDNYAWSLEETRTDGGKRTVAIQKAGDRG